MAFAPVKTPIICGEWPLCGVARRFYVPLIGLVFCLLTAAPSSAQELSAAFHPLKAVYISGEPVWFVFEVTNKGKRSVQIEDSNPYGVCAFGGGYSFDVPGAGTVGRWQCGYGASCVGGGSTLLAPGATYTQRLLLNQWFLIDHPGKYRVSANRSLSFSVGAGSFAMAVAPQARSFRTEFEVAIVEGEEAKVEKAFGPFLKNLSSRKFDLRIEAVETITSMAPPVLEKTLIALANTGDSFAKSRAIKALGRLKTTKSKRVLAKLIEDRQQYYSWQAIDALAETGDQAYVPLLAKLAREPAWQNEAIPAWGELGGQRAVSFLAPLVHHPLGPPNEPPVQSLAIRGLANTRSGEAIPYLIGALRNPLVHQDAVKALAQLTHFVIWDEKSNHWLYTEDEKTANRMAERWQRWWKSTGGKAKLYGPGECTTSPDHLP